MSILLHLLDMLLKPETPKPFLSARVLGFILLWIAAAIGMYFLFQGLVPVIGYLESGAVICVMLVLAGLLCLLLHTEKQEPKPLDKIVKSATSVYTEKQEAVENIFKEDAPNLILYSCLAGLTLYQIITSIKNKSKN